MFISYTRIINQFNIRVFVFYTYNRLQYDTLLFLFFDFTLLYEKNTFNIYLIITSRYHVQYNYYSIIFKFLVLREKL